MNEAAHPRILLVDDHPLVRDGIRMRLEMSLEVEVVGEAADARTAMALTAALAPDIVITDIRMPNANGISLLAALNNHFRGVKTLVLSMLKEPAYVRRTMAMGARGYVLKDDPSEHLIDAIRTVNTGEIYLSQRVASLVDAGLPLERALPALTPKEIAILNLLAKGCSNKEIASLLGSSIRTVESHRLNLRRKLGVEGRAALVKYAIDYSDLGFGPSDVLDENDVLHE
ncbi:response regulator transcription factor [Thauera sp. SDU_THAU2]|uniref:response regulator transcription factor n=1 Tax=Thauera sp. SDU_THAU2 TaxID=3136633 RepID=UPI00311F5904